MSGSIHRFGNFEVDARRREIRRDGLRMDLPAKAFDCLIYLIEHRDRIVGRDELISAVWGRSDLSDNLLAQSILRVRRALDDDGSVQAYVRTITGSGYRWVGQLDSPGAPKTPQAPAADRVDDTSPSSADAPLPPVSSAKPQRARYVAIGLALLAVVLAAGLFVRTSRSPRIIVNANAGSSLVLVLPAAVHDNPDARWMSLGIMGLIAERLHDIGVATVPSESVVALTKSADTQAPPLDELRATTQADTVVASEIEKKASLWTVTLKATRGDAAAIVARGTNADAFAAADAAVGQIITQLFSAEYAGHGETTPLDELVARVNAAFLADQFDQAHALVGEAPDEMRRDPRVRLVLARAQLVAGHHEAALAELQKLAGEEAARNNPVTEARIQTLISNAHLRLNNFATSAQEATAAIDLLRAHPSSVSASDLGAALNARAIAWSAQDEVGKALEDFTAARAALAGTGNVRLQATVDVNYSVLQISHGRHEEAIASLARSADLFRRLRIPSNELTARMNLLTAYVYLQNLDAGAAEEPRIAELVARSADPNVCVVARMTSAQSAIDRGSLAQAETYIDAIPTDDAEVYARFEGQIRSLEAQIALARGDFKTAEERAAKAVVLPWSVDEPRFLARAWWFFARASTRTTADHGKAAVARAREWAAKQTEPVASLYEELVEAEASAVLGDRETRTRYEAALAAAVRFGAPIDLVAVTSSYAEWLLDQHDFARAREVLSRNEGWQAMSYPVLLAYVRLYRDTGDETAWRSAVEQARQIARDRPFPEPLARFERMAAEQTKAR
jgi:DNA-binding winged helix-turn-helix (wHTH) protein/tetratricopeptide (TPR) repeat protein